MSDIMWRIVNTDNFCRDYPDERFVCEPFPTKAEAQDVADEMNDLAGKHSERYFKVEQESYVLQPGFEP